MNNEFESNFPNPKENEFEIRKRIFTPGMPVIIQGIPFMSKGTKGHDLILRILTPQNVDQLQGKMKRALKGITK
jgi:hypothetical protein